MDIKNAFLNGPIKEEAYVEQPPGFESEECLRTFFLKMVLELVRPTLLSSLEKWVKMYFYAKYMLMILYLALLTNPFVTSLAK
jgi:hypothetical protein